MALGGLMLTSAPAAQSVYDISVTGHRSEESALIDLVPEYREPVEKQQLDMTQLLLQQQQQQGALLQQLISQNDAMHRQHAGQREFNESVRDVFQGLTRPQEQPAPGAPAQGGVDWNQVFNNKATPPAAPVAQGVQWTPQQLQSAVDERIAKERNDFTRLQQEMSGYDAHFRQNFPELAPYYGPLQDYFRMQTQMPGNNLAQAYNNTIAYGKTLQTQYKPVHQPARPAPQGGGYYPGMDGGPEGGKTKVKDMMGQVYTIQNYLEGVVPLVEYKDLGPREEKHLRRYAAAREAQQDVRKFKRPVKALEKYPEFWKADDDEFEDAVGF